MAIARSTNLSIKSRGKSMSLVFSGTHCSANLKATIDFPSNVASSLTPEPSQQTKRGILDSYDQFLFHRLKKIIVRFANGAHRTVEESINALYMCNNLQKYFILIPYLILYRAVFPNK
jgi:hypothetical protein